ncbi:MAG: hypothetical protein EBT73_02185 [Actinobacteria bacterium]|nr:hypothetical protein [Actinomycetota bacterium]
MALAADPEMVFLDEPTAGVDLDGRDIIREIIGDLVGKGACVVLATHDLDEAQRVAHHAVVLHHGRVVINERRLGVTPLGRGRLIAAKSGAVAVVEVVQCLLLVVVAVALGWSLDAVSWWRLGVAVALGTLGFAGIGLSLAGRLRAEVNLAAQNGLYLVLLALGGVLVPSDELPDAMAEIARWLPSGATHGPGGCLLLGRSSPRLRRLASFASRADVAAHKTQTRFM